MKLRDLVSALPEVQLPTEAVLEQEITGLATNSQTCRSGDLFIGLPGTRVDGGEFWQGAVDQGAIAAVVSQAVADRAQQTQPDKALPLIAVADVVSACARLAAHFHNYPTQQMALVGVTGTNGKTTTTHLIEFFLNQAHYPTALLGTLYTRWPGMQQVASHTTPFAVELQHTLAQAIQAGCRHGVMEVSSHALAQGRVLGCQFQVAVFTNLTQDHLDFHCNMENYFKAKALLFQPGYLADRAVINQDDPYGQRLAAELGDRSWRYSVTNNTTDLYTHSLVYGETGVSGLLCTPKGEIPFQSPLVGQFNLANLLAAIGAALALDLDLATLVAALPQFPGVPGRMERVQVQPEQEISVIVDYAHTPDSLENLLKAARPFIAGQMICVFGCGGDRDRTKRPQMGKIAADLADQVVVTSDNPRTEDPKQILQDILAGIPETVRPIVELDRAVAIHQAIHQAKPGDGVLIAGKGHEDYQILGTNKIHFDDREQARSALLARLENT